MHVLPEHLWMGSASADGADRATTAAVREQDKDRLFPLDGVMRIYEKTRHVYDLYGASNQLGLTVIEGGHADSPDFHVPVLRWFNRHLKGEDPPITTGPKKYFAPEQLKVFATLPTNAIQRGYSKVFCADG